MNEYTIEYAGIEICRAAALDRDARLRCQCGGLVRGKEPVAFLEAHGLTETEVLKRALNGERHSRYENTTNLTVRAQS